MSMQSAPRWNRLEPDERRRQILAAAVRLFADRAYSDVSMVDVAEAAGVARGLIHHYIGGKRDLYLECVRFMVTVPPVEEIDLPTGSLEERARGVVHWLIGVLEVHGSVWVRMASGTGVDPQVSDILDEADELAAERVLQSTGFTGSDAERALTMSVVRAFGGMVKAAGREWLIRDALSRSEVEELLTATLLSVLHTSHTLSKNSIRFD